MNLEVSTSDFTDESGANFLMIKLLTFSIIALAMTIWYFHNKITCLKINTIVFKHMKRFKFTLLKFYISCTRVSD